MKKIIILIMLTFTTLSGVWCQDKLHVSKVFEDYHKPALKSKAIETLVKGSTLKPYNLSLFRSLKVSCTQDQYASISNLVLEDSKAASDKELEIEGGRLIYALLRFFDASDAKKSKEKSRYLGFQLVENKDNETYNLLLVYFEGTADLAHLKKLLKTK